VRFTFRTTSHRLKTLFSSMESRRLRPPAPSKACLKVSRTQKLPQATTGYTSLERAEPNLASRVTANALHGSRGQVPELRLHSPSCHSRTVCWTLERELSRNPTPGYSVVYCYLGFTKPIVVSTKCTGLNLHQAHHEILKLAFAGYTGIPINCTTTLRSRHRETCNIAVEIFQTVPR